MDGSSFGEQKAKLSNSYSKMQELSPTFKHKSTEKTNQNDIFSDAKLSSRNLIDIPSERGCGDFHKT